MVEMIICYPRYAMLSERRKNEVDKVRVRGIQRLLDGVTLVSMVVFDVLLIHDETARIAILLLRMWLI